MIKVFLIALASVVFYCYYLAQSIFYFTRIDALEKNDFFFGSEIKLICEFLKKQILILVFVFSSFAYGQVTNGSVEYNLIFQKDEQLENSNLSQYYKSAVENSKFVIFKLDFNANKMFFYPSVIDGLDSRNTKFSITFSGVNGKIFKDNATTYLLEEKRNMFGAFLLKKEIDLKWNISNEYKIIQNFKCFKASTTITCNDGVGEYKKDVIAWYCPQIPLSYGPKGYVGLPGLVLELQENNVLFVAHKIILNQQDFKLPNDLKGKIVTEEEYTQMFQNTIKETGNVKK